MTLTALADRALVTVSGAQAQSFLQALITTDLDALADDEARPGALLTPQGKILFDFMVTRMPVATAGETAFRLDTSSDQAAPLHKRLMMYRLRAPVELAVDTTTSVAISLDAVTGGYGDSRFDKAGIVLQRVYGADGAQVLATDADDGAYDAARLAGGIAESGRDYALQDAFPHDVLLDLNGGLSFRKGCYVGQEVVSRMQHRGTARRRVVTVTAQSDLPVSGTVLTVDGKAIGTLGTVRGTRGLAIVRIDKAGEAMSSGSAIVAGDVVVTVALPAWSGLSFTASADEASA